MTKGIFVTAVGTDVGKTYVSALLCKELKERGCAVNYWKPALSGASIPPRDDVFVKDRAVLNDENITVSYVFAEGVSPHLAAARSGVTMTLEKMRADLEIVKNSCDFAVAEGCGGIICPLSLGGEPLMLVNVMKMAAMELIIVTESGLGSINSAALTVSYGKNMGLSIKGMIMNRYDETNFMHCDNRRVIEALTGLPVLATVAPHGDQLQWSCRTPFPW